VSLSSSVVLARHELRLFRREPGMLLQMVFMPIVMIAFLKPAFGPALAQAGYEGATGAEQAVPGMIVMFSFFGAGMVGFAFFREHGWGTWDRLRASQARSFEIVVGKAVPTFLLVTGQQLILFVVGVWLFDLHIRGSLLGLGLVSIALALCLLAFGVVFAAFLRSSQALNAVNSLTVMTLAGLGGAFTPIDALPGWAQMIAPATPTYWAMVGYRAVVLDAGGVGATLRPVAVLMLFAAALTGLAVHRFSFDEAKLYTG
jgi:ABC-2 type transport system permease protein